MSQTTVFADAIGRRGFAASGHRERAVLKSSEYSEIELPSDIILSDGSLDLYDDVQSYIEVQFNRKRGRLVIRSNGWVGHIPLNDAYALEVDTRVPVGNLERLLSRAPGTKVELLDRYSHRYSATEDRPKSLYDILIDRFLFTIEEIRRDGLHKEYVRRDRVSLSPFGRINPRRTALLTQIARSPTAAYSAFERTTDVPPNRLLRLALMRALLFYSKGATAKGDRRYERLLDAANHFSGVGEASPSDITPEAFYRFARNLPEHRTAYVDALRLAEYIIANHGLAVRGAEGDIYAPPALVGMAAVFESYARSVLEQSLTDQRTRVLDGNIAGERGAKQSLFTSIHSGSGGPTVQPDIVLSRDGRTRVIIDVKYKPPDLLPDRSETNQMACYAARYRCDTVMVLYPRFPKKIERPVELVGSINELKLYRAVLNIGAHDLAQAEIDFCAAMKGVLEAASCECFQQPARD